jgi:FAD dependent oxidoreductase TIGR03364
MKNPFDLTVIGAGVLGTFHAYHALRHGLSVLLLEKDSQPQSATVRNFGQVVPSGLNNTWFDYGRRSLEIYKEIQQEFDLSIRAQGSLYLASDKDEQQLLHELMAIYHEKDYPCRLLSKQDCLQKWRVLKPSYVKEGLFFPEEISLDPRLMIHRLISYLGLKYERFCYRAHSPVFRVEQQGDRLKVFSSGDSGFITHRVLICNGAHFELLYPDIFRQSGLLLSKLQMMRTRPMLKQILPGNILTGLSIRRYESFAACPSFKNLNVSERQAELQKWGIHILFKQADDGSLILGDSHEYAKAGSPELLDYELKQEINQLILEEAENIVNISLGPFESSWAGIYSQHPDGIFYKRVADNIHILTGIGGKGMTSGPGYAEHMLTKIIQ